MRKITSQQAAPARKGTQVVSALPQRWRTIHNVRAAPAQTGNKAMAMINLAHFGTPKELRIHRRDTRNKKFSDREN
jgi:hypothetical protein